MVIGLEEVFFCFAVVDGWCGLEKPTPTTKQTLSFSSPVPTNYEHMR